MTDRNPSREAALFLQLVLGLQQAAMVGLGKLMNPVSGKIERNLDAAKNTIDTLGAIETRVRAAWLGIGAAGTSTLPPSVWLTSRVFIAVRARVEE
mgnify:CR=1 FL=1